MLQIISILDMVKAVDVQMIGTKVRNNHQGSPNAKKNETETDLTIL